MQASLVSTSRLASAIARGYQRVVILVLAEKPSVARDLAAVLGAHSRREGYFEGAGYRVTWAIGHLVGLAEPHEIEARWRTWSRASLPMLPHTFPLVVLEQGRAQYRIVERLLRARDTASVVAATDAGREGELIFRYIYERAGCKKPWQRLWVSSLTEPAIRAALAKLQPGRRYDGLADAAKARSRADWLVGMNLSRAYTLAQGTLCSVGRVQTPTLAMVVERDRQIREFVPQHYCEVEAEFEAPAGRYRGTYHRITPDALRAARGKLRAISLELARLPSDGQEAEQIARRARAGRAHVVAVEDQTRRTPPPLLYDLTELQRHANRLFGFTAKHTLDVAQTLYEKHKLLSYPRTDSRHLSAEVAVQLPEIVGAIAPRYPGLVAPGSSERQLSRRFVDSSKVSDHHAIIPTALAPRLVAGSAEARLYDLVCRRVLMAWHADLIEALTTVVTAIEASADDAPDFFLSRGTARAAAGWTVLELRATRPQPSAAEPDIPPGLRETGSVGVLAARVERRQTQPPRPFSEATLLTAMESAGRSLSDRELIAAMGNAGLGTPATRAAILETLLARGYLLRAGKNLQSTPAGEALIATVHERVKSAEMTGSWELRLHRMERGEEGFDAFMREIEAYVSEVVSAVGELPAKPRRTEAQARLGRGSGSPRAKRGKKVRTAKRGAEPGTGRGSGPRRAPVKRGVGARRAEDGEGAKRGVKRRRTTPKRDDAPPIAEHKDSEPTAMRSVIRNVKRETTPKRDDAEPSAERNDSQPTAKRSVIRNVKRRETAPKRDDAPASAELPRRPTNPPNAPRHRPPASTDTGSPPPSAAGDAAGALDHPLRTVLPTTVPGRAAGSVVDALRRWRVATADRQRIATFLLLGDRQLFELARARPTSRYELQGAGLNAAFIAEHGDEILALLRRAGGADESP
jgi:DNA topoisomerase-3